MSPADQHLIPLLCAAGISSMGWLMVYMPEPAPRFYMFLRGRQGERFVQFRRFAGRLFGTVFAAWTVVFSILIVADLLR
jgi:hypothetical protein